MADLNFACPHCNKTIACDEQWSGHEIQCPICQGALVVPAAQAPPPPKPGGGGARLAANAQTPAQTGNRNIPIRNLTAPPPKKQSALVGILCGTAVIAGLGAGGYFGYGYYQGMKEKKAQAEQAAAAAAAQAAAAQAEAAAPPPVSKPPTYTLEIAQATIPDGAVNGTISGTNFVAETIRVDPVGTAQVLRFFQGEMTSPDREVLVYLQLKPGEKLGGQSLTISNQMKGAGVPQVAKRWKVSPQYPPSLQAYHNGYAMKLELGQAAADGTLPGKIFLALPDQEKTVVAGVFKASVTPADPNAQAMQQQPQNPATPAQPSGFDRSAYEKRYGIRRR